MAFNGWGSKLNRASIVRENYIAEAVYFIPSGEYRIESVAPDYSVRLSSETLSVETLQAVLDNHAVLTVNATKATIQANDVDTVRFSIAGQTTFAYTLFKENILLDSGNVADGFLDFATDDEATYYVELKLANGQTGYAKVIAQ